MPQLFQCIIQASGHFLLQASTYAHVRQMHSHYPRQQSSRSHTTSMRLRSARFTRSIRTMWTPIKSVVSLASRPLEMLISCRSADASMQCKSGHTYFGQGFLAVRDVLTKSGLQLLSSVSIKGEDEIVSASTIKIKRWIGAHSVDDIIYNASDAMCCVL